MDGLFPNEAIDQIWVLYRKKPRGILDVRRRGHMATISIYFCELIKSPKMRKAPKENEQILNDKN